MTEKYADYASVTVDAFPTDKALGGDWFKTEFALSQQQSGPFGEENVTL